ncbi:hypothetical protein JQ633_33180 [Bradyrhizobium tropiciagri]|uniref:hypothetical protein n=1 Tax=Bradyrhizobium tropiciagri TaxID=312253 RepID=UPI001BAD0794|nr:hypothetical protein [Bradyrhizobium tropiciagri]MBR0875254.1 hypothetical protein [Bradyrhizobium tropiciagri]
MSSLKKFQPLIFICLMLVAFDIAYSLLSTCQQTYPAASKDYHQGHCTTFGGVIPWVVGVSLHPLTHFLETYEHALVSGFTVVLAVFTARLWYSTEKLWKATRDTATNQERDTRILQRAYISVEPAGIVASGSAFLCHPNIIIRNVGNLPAKKVRWTITHTFDESDRFNDFPVDEGAAEGEVTLSPGTAMTQGAPRIKFDQKEFGKYYKVFIYIWGIIIYDDGFGEIRRSRFCHRYNGRNIEVLFAQMGPVKAVSGHEILVENARLHRYGNDSD